MPARMRIWLRRLGPLRAGLGALVVLVRVSPVPPWAAVRGEATPAATVVPLSADTWGNIEVPPGLSRVTAVAAGYAHSLALKVDGTVVAWGDNDHGQAGVPPALRGVVAVAAGGDHSLALRADGTVVAWGDSRHDEAASAATCQSPGSPP